MALTLKRKEGEAIILILPNDQEIRLEVYRLQGESVKLAIDAPLDVEIHREELLEEFPATASSATSPTDNS